MNLFYNTFVSGAALSFTLFVNGQTGPLRYKDRVSETIKEEKNLCYFPASSCKKAYRFDLYQPDGDSMTQRPLIIWMHGGGFKFGSKSSKSIRLWSKTFAGRGYVCAAVNYRLSKKNPLFHFRELVRSCSDAVQDIQLAMSFFKENHLRFRIDTNKIILAGNSAGGIIALQAAYSSSAELVQLENGGQLQDVLDPGYPVSKPLDHGKTAAVINFWGALFDLAWLSNSRVPIVSVHGTKDRIVPIDHKGSSFYGSGAIHTRADSLQIPNRLKIFEGYSHELQKHFNPFFPGKASRQRWLEAGQFAADFLYEELFSSSFSICNYW